MKYLYILLLILFFPLILQAQKETSRIIDASNIQSIHINSDEIYRVTVKTAPVNSITILTKADGEYSNEINLDLKIARKTLYLQSQFREILQSGFDKLSAHKVLAMEVEMKIPYGMHVEVRSNVASVFLWGSFKDVILELKSGSGFLKDFRGDAVVNTYDGNIEVETRSPKIEASSRHGKVVVPTTLQGSNRLALTSINGDIKVMETK
jgi:hypothetical protein